MKNDIDKEIIEKYELDENIAKILYLRGIKESNRIEEFFNRNKVTDSSQLTNISKVTKRIKKAIENKEKIVICGDYDVDGTVSTAMLYRYFNQINYRVHYYIPHRVDEGYGISAIGVEKLYQEGYTLLISVDNGISAFDAGLKAKELGIDLIITDHHDPKDILPEAFTILNPKLDKNEKCKFLSGAGVTFYLINELNRELDFKINLRPYLVLAMIASVADVVPLLDDNRVIVKQGLNLLNKYSIKGIDKLLSSLSMKRNITAKDIGYKVCPILNSSGRLEGAEKTIQLLIEDDDDKILDLIEQLKKLNLERRELSNISTERALKDIDNSHKIIIIDGIFHQGIIGIIASKIKEKFNKPVVIIGFEENNPIGKASCRSINGFNIKKAVDETSSYHLGGGGHYMAAGFSIDKNQVLKFKEELYKYADNQEFLTEDPIIDLDLSIKDFNKKFIEQLEKLEPFGAKFESPRIKYSGKVTDLKILKNEHLLLKLDKKISLFVFFSKLSEDLNKYRIGNHISIIGELSVSQNEPKIILLK